MLLVGCEDLEFHCVLAQAAGFCQSAAGRRLLQSAVPGSAREVVERLLDETCEAAEFWQQTVAASPAGFSLLPEDTSFLGAFREGLVPQKEELLALGDFLRVVESARRVLAHLRPQRYPRLNELTAGFASLDDLTADYRRRFNEEGEVRDGASKQLKELRADLAKLQSTIEGRIRGLIRHRAPQLAEEIHLSIRNNRLTVNVPAGLLHQFKGMVVDYSASGASVYVEPQEVVELNNERQQLFLAEEMEVRRVIQEFAQRVEASREDILSDFRILAGLDAVFGRARYSLAIHGTRPALNEDGRIRLRQAKHPLMIDSFVPEDLEFADERVLIISGVNAGGKSVLLKMLGLFALMVCCGLLIPAGGGSELALFDAVFVNIGDEQSVLNNLSTFTAHVRFLRSLMEHLERRPRTGRLTLALIDELGTGTDPHEGSALGYAVVERLRELPVKAALTTHYDLIKTLGEKYPECKNVSLAFDESKLMPSYRVLDGIPGRSYAFDIARSQGLPADLLARAGELTTQAEEAFTEVLSALRAKQEELEAELGRTRWQRQELAVRAEEAERERAQLRDREAQLRRQLDGLRREFELKAEEFIGGARRKLRDKLRTSRGRSGLEVASEFSAEARTRKESALADLERRLGLAPAVEAEKPTFAEGDTVRLHALGADGQVLRVDEAKRTLEIAVRGKTLKLSWEKARELTCPPESAHGAKHLRMSREQRRRLRELGAELDAENTGVLFTTAQQLDLHGHTAAEAEPKLERFISDAILNDFTEVAILHGLGSGALRRFVHQWLQSCEQVASFRQALPAEGGPGITIVALK